ncbi:hypothetical protein ACHAP5_003526 [Fusarium lateritium]
MDEFNQNLLTTLVPFRERADWTLGQLEDAIRRSDREKMLEGFEMWDIQARSEDFDPDVMSQGEKRLLEVACKQGDFSMVQYLLEERKIKPTGFNAYPFVMEGDVYISCALVSHGFDVDQPWSPFPLSVLAYVFRRLDKVNHLLSLGADPNMVSKCGLLDIPTYAAQHASVEVVAMLEISGAKFSRSNALHRAVLMADVDDQRFAIMDFLLINEMVDINQLEYAYKEDGPNAWPGNGTALHCAVRANSLSSVKYLLAWKADLNVKDRLGCTPLDQAIRYDHEEIKKVLEDAQQRSQEDELPRDASANGRDNEEQEPDADSELSSRLQPLKF